MSSAALREVHTLAIKQFLIPGDAGWPLGTLFPPPRDRAEGGRDILTTTPLVVVLGLVCDTGLTVPCLFPPDNFKAYFKQARDELGIRLVDRLFDADGTKNKWWQVSALSRNTALPGGGGGGAVEDNARSSIHSIHPQCQSVVSSTTSGMT